LASAPSPVAATALPGEADLAAPSALASAFVGAFAGLIVGIGWAYYLIDDRRRRFVDKLEPSEVLGSELLGTVRLDSRSPLLVLQHPKSRAYSVFNDVNKRLAVSMNGSNKALGVASTALDPTKSQVALNIALMGADNGRKTLFIDGDMESHTASQILAQILERPRDVGLAEILGGQRNMTGAIQTLGTDNGTLHFIPSGKFAPGVAPSASQLREVIEALEEHYDLIVIDLPQRLDSRSVEAYSKANVDVVVAVRDRSRVRSGYETRSRFDTAGIGQLGYLYTYRPGILSRTP
jgi:Mrp family chromosome partitioning ATPase